MNIISTHTIRFNIEQSVVVYADYHLITKNNKVFIEASNTKKVIYQLSELKSLYTELYKVKLSSDKDILNLVKTYGLLSGDSDKNVLDFQSIELELLRSKLEKYKVVFESFIKVVFQKELDKADNTLLNMIQQHNILNIKLNFNKKTNTILEFKDLLDFSLFQMFKAYNHECELRTCKCCGHYFEVEHDKMQFCRKLPNRKRSSCEMKYHNRMRNK